MRLLVNFILLILPSFSFADVNPQNGTELNYTHVMFEYDAITNATKYEYIIIEKKTKKKIVFTSSKNIYLLKDQLNFDHNYQWWVNVYTGAKKIYQSDSFSFSIGTHQNIQKKYIKFEITKSEKGKFQDDILFIDHLGIAINRKGEPIWYLPEREEKLEDKNNFRTLQMTSSGTLTFLYNSNCYEIDLQGNVVWKAPKNGIFSESDYEEYHHDFAKLPHGSYMTCSYKYKVEKNFHDETIESRVRYATLIEYDKDGRMLWSWYEKEHIPRSIIFQNETPGNKDVAGTHMNGFTFSKKDNAFYLSFRNTSQVYKIDYLTGKVKACIDGKADLKQKTTGIRFFQQHGPSLTKEGNIIIYNNNINPTKKDNEILYPKVVIISNPPDSTTPFKKIWEYECVWDKKPNGIMGKEGFARELENGNIFVNTGGAERLFEVTKNKKVVWDCATYKLNTDSSAFLPFSNYRCYSTKSLYPVYFIVSKTNNKLVIENIGNQDEYEITFYNSTQDQVYYSTQSKVVPSGGKYLIEPDNSIKGGYTVIVKSKANPSVLKKITVKT